jgi:hypothetical protein
MNRSKHLVASSLVGLSLVAVGFVATSSQGNAGAMTAAERVQSAFALLAETGSTNEQAVRTVMVGYQTDSSANLLLRKPGL